MGIEPLILSVDAYEAWLRQPFLDEQLAGDDALSLVVIAEPDGDPSPEVTGPGSLPVVVAALGRGFGTPGPTGADLVIGPDDVDALVGAVSGAPLAATSLAVLLRASDGVSVDDGLAAESAVYSMLQAGPEFTRWQASRGTTGDRPPDVGGSPTVRVSRVDDVLRIELDRPSRHNAISTRLRDELVAAFGIAVADADVRTVELSGRGPSFCSGGDLDEFGMRPDPATAHRTRLARSPARLIHRLGNVTSHVHGATMGGGIEMAAFCRHVVAASDTRIALPEIGLGLIPGAGGTVGLPRRIGRQRTAALALTGRTIDAATALQWGLVDRIED